MHLMGRQERFLSNMVAGEYIFDRAFFCILSICRYIDPSTCLSDCCLCLLSVCLSICLSVLYPSTTTYLYICLHICLTLSVCVHTCAYVYLYACMDEWICVERDECMDPNFLFSSCCYSSCYQL